MSGGTADKRRGAPVVKKAANGFYYIHWSEGRRSKRQSTGTSDEDEAYQTFAQWILIGGHNRTIGATEATYSVAELWGVYWQKHVTTSKVTSEGQKTAGFAWKNLEPHFGHMLPGDINQQQIDDYAARRTHASKDKLGRKSTTGTARRELAYLIAALNHCARGKTPLIDPKSLPIIDLPAADAPRDRWLRMEEVQRLLTAAATMRRQGRGGGRMTRAERFLWIALETAARKQAILDLTWDRVDFEIGTIQFDVPGRVKTTKGRATVPISSALRPVLERAYKERISDLVLDNKAAVWKSIQVASIKAGFSDQTVVRGQKPKATGISPHVLRHTAATHMARRGVPLFVVAIVLGNSVQMVERVYAKWQSNDASDNVDLISGGILEPAE